MDWMNVARFPERDVGPYFFSVPRQGCIWGQGFKSTSLDNAQIYCTWEYLLLKVNSTRQTTGYKVTLRRIHVTIVAVEKQ
jgi:hypothetical protein